MADEKEKKTTTAKAPAKTVRRVKKTAQKVQTVQKKAELQQEDRRMSQEALGMVETLEQLNQQLSLEQRQQEDLESL